MKTFLQEIRDFEKYKDCLSTELYRVYRNYLVEKVLKEMSPEFLARNFERFLNQNEIDGPEATIEAVNRLKKATLQVKYSKLHNQIVKSIHTNLESDDGKFCDKETFIQEFKKLNFDDLKGKSDLAVDDTIEAFLNKYLEMYDENGWLMLPDYEDVKELD